MMRFIAILKDSFREAVDGFVIYVMLALSALMALFPERLYIATEIAQPRRNQR